MAGKSLGPVHVTFTARTKEFQAGVEAGRKQMQRFAQTADTTSRRMQKTTGGSKNLGRGMLELSRGVEDAAVSFGTGGLSGAIRGAANNMSQMAFIMGGPVAGAIAGVVSAVSSALIPAFTKGSKSIDKMTSAAGFLKDALKDITEETKRVFSAKFGAEDFNAAFFAARRGGDPEAAKRLRDEQEKNIKEAARRRDTARANRNRADKLFRSQLRTLIETSPFLAQQIDRNIGFALPGSKGAAFREKFGTGEKFLEQVRAGQVSSKDIADVLKTFGGGLTKEQSKQIALVQVQLEKFERQIKDAEAEVRRFNAQAARAGGQLADNQKRSGAEFAKNAGAAVEKEFAKMFDKEVGKVERDRQKRAEKEAKSIGSEVGRVFNRDFSASIREHQQRQRRLASLPGSILNSELQINSLRRQLLPKFTGLDLRGGGASVGRGGAARAVQASVMELQNARAFAKSPQIKLDEERNRLLKEKLSSAERELKGMRSELSRLQSSNLSGP